MNNAWFALIVLAASSANADWTLYGIGRDPVSREFLDLKTATSTGSYMRVWTLTDSPEDMTTGSGVRHRSVKILVEYDCAGQRSRALASIATSGQMGTGGVVLSDMDISKPGPWMVLPAGSVGHRAAVLVCQRGSIFERTRTWTPIATDQRTSILLDRASVRSDGRLVRARTLYDYPSAQADYGLSWRSSVFDLEIDCANETFRILSYVSYAAPHAEGSPVEAVPDTTTPLHAYPPDGPVSSQARAICALKGR